MLRMKTRPELSDDEGATWVPEVLVQEFVEAYPHAIWILGGVSDSHADLDTKYWEAACARN